jgi:16S rRNA (cytosine967-C5)-methyltransferase
VATTRVSPARRAAFDVLFRVATQDSYASELLHSNLVAALDQADRGLATELVMGTLRWQQKLDDVVAATANKPITKFDLEVKIALRLGAYQLIYLDRIPARASVNESVELVKLHGKRSAAPLVNAVLRKLSAQAHHKPEDTESLEDIASAYSHPAWLVQRWSKIYGPDIARAICEHNQQRPHTTIRATSPAVREELARAGIELEPASLLTNAWQVKKGDVTATYLYQQRRLAVQDEGSQLVGLLARGKTILDCCAAPGGKSAVAAERNSSALVVSLDLHLHRVRLMRQLIGSEMVVAADARKLPFDNQFDCVIADVPCTGTGTLARNPEIKWRMVPEDLLRLATLQLEILGSVAKQTRSIVYSTCSLEPEEGEEVVSRFVSSNPRFRIASIAPRLRELTEEGFIKANAVESLLRGDFLRTFPGLHNCDGFFAALLERVYPIVLFRSGSAYQE